ncbi:glutaredoxin-C9-like [Hibiscus syriacus]|uniref:glutaredoxin-C9-like n=1 Tax=Hibiscus syriacus TaxID=106335 RepID=UPI0019216D3A|nr:glutaredoxin-C9-like [Hibiscus syriacus]
MSVSGSRSLFQNFLLGGGGLVTNGGAGNSMRKLVEENAVVVFGHGVKPVVFEVGEGKEEAEAVNELSRSGGVQLPGVFVGGKLFGGLDRVM